MAALLLFVVREGFQQPLYLGRLEGVWPVAFDALIRARTVAAGWKHELRRLPALPTNAFVHWHRDPLASGSNLNSCAE